MKKIPAKTQERIRNLRDSGFTHRQIAKILHVAQGTAVTYSRGIHLTPQQKVQLNIKNYKNSLGKLTTEERYAASRKGGKNSTSHFPVKYSAKELISLLKNFHTMNGRIPTKRDFVALYRPILRVFKTWNNAIAEAGFSPNPVRFAKKFIANDGHICDSLSEKIIDDWLRSRRILHERHVRYFHTKYTVDFKVNDIYIEFFGLHGQLESYDKLILKKLDLLRTNKIKLIALYPTDIFPKSKLDMILGNLL